MTADPEIKVYTVLPGDQFIILASDGLWDVFGNKEAVDLVRRRPRADAAEALVAKAIKKGSSDNVTAVIVWLDWGTKM